MDDEPREKAVLWVPWERVQALLVVGNRLADATGDQATADEWDEARYKIVPQTRTR